MKHGPSFVVGLSVTDGDWTPTLLTQPWRRARIGVNTTHTHTNTQPNLISDWSFEFRLSWNWVLNKAKTTPSTRLPPRFTFITLLQTCPRNTDKVQMLNFRTSSVASSKAIQQSQHQSFGLVWAGVGLVGKRSSSKQADPESNPFWLILLFQRRGLTNTVLGLCSPQLIQHPHEQKENGTSGCDWECENASNAMAVVVCTSNLPFYFVFCHSSYYWEVNPRF